MIGSHCLTGSARHLKLAAAMLPLSFTAFGQTTALPFHYTLFNPASTGLLNRQEANVSFLLQPHNGYVNTAYLANYQARVSPLHGALGVTYLRNQIQYGYSDRLSLNYSYHIRLGEQSTLAAGASVGLISSSWKFPYGENFSRHYLTTSLGVSFKRREFHAGISLQDPVMMELPGGSVFSERYVRGLTLFAENTWTLSPAWKLRASGIMVSGYGLSATVLATVKDRFWFGLSASTRSYGAMVGYDFKNGMSLGYSFEAATNGITQHRPPGHGLTLRFRLP